MPFIQRDWASSGAITFPVLVFAALTVCSVDLEALDSATYRILSCLIFVFMCLSVTVCGGSMILSSLKARGGGHFLFSILSAGLLGFVAIAAIKTPLNSWDSLSHWGPQAVLAAEAMSEGSRPDIWWHRHPPAVPAILASIILATESFSLLFNASAIFWVFCVLILAYSSRIVIDLDQRDDLIICGAVLSIPYVTNHVILWGYADLPLASSVMLLLAAFKKCCTDGLNVLTSIGGIVALVCAMLFKNIAVLFVVIFFVSFVMAYCNLLIAKLSGLRSETIFKLAIITIIILSGAIIGEYKGEVVRIFGKSLIIQIPPLEATLQLLAEIFFINTSYSAAPLLFVIVYTYVFFFSGRFCWDFELLSVLFISIFVMELWVLSLYTEYGFTRAVPSRDTGGTRHLLTPIIINLLVLLAISRRYGDRAEKHMSKSAAVE